MARSKPARGSRSAALRKTALQKSLPSADPPVPPSEQLDIDSALDRIRELVLEGQQAEALNLARKLVRQEPEHAVAVERLAEVEVELGELAKAKKHFVKAVQLAGSEASSSAHLYLAQLASDAQESLSHFRAALGIVRPKLESLCAGKGGPVALAATDAGIQANGKEKGWSTEEKELRRTCSRTLVGMTELYLTDLCFDPSAESNCVEYLTTATSLDPTDPEPLQTLASVRLSQSDPSAARQLLLQSWTHWRDASILDEAQVVADDDAMEAAGDGEDVEEDEEDDELPPFETRLGWAKLAIECELYGEAVEVLQGCEAEDDEDEEVLYLLGVTWELIGRTKDASSSTAEGKQMQEDVGPVEYRVRVGDGLSQEECWLEAGEYLESCLKLHDKLESDEAKDQGLESALDDEAIQHVRELLADISRAGIVVSPAKDADEGVGVDDDDWVDEEEEEEDVEMGDG